MTAAGLASQIQPGSTVRWDRLELEAFSAVPDFELPPRSPRASNNGLTAAQWVVILLSALVAFALFVTPTVGLAAITYNPFTIRQLPASDMIPVAGVLYAIALPVSIGCLVVWLLRQRRYNASFETFAASTFVLGILTAVTIDIRGGRESVDGFGLWLVPVVATVVVSGASWALLVLARSRTAGPDEDSGPYGERLPLKPYKVLVRRRRVVAALAEERQREIRDDLEAMILDLERRGLIGEADAERARETELGGLGLRMWRGKKSASSERARAS